jgi:2-dehydro-3-deoxyphosphogluconate aldolase/(4S)-4-hydroxy-2-oxoglutarate aldolase
MKRIKRDKADVLRKIGELGVIPVTTIGDCSSAKRLATALIAGRLPCIEVTFRDAAAVCVLNEIREDFPELLLGAGTVVNLDQAKQARDAGVDFIVSPGLSDEIVHFCKEHDLLSIPGISTPSEIMRAMHHHLNVLKFFPAMGTSGVPVLKAMSAAFPGIFFVPTGGISPENLSEWFNLPSVFAVGGTWMVTIEMIAGGDFNTITRLAGDAVDAIQKIRQGKSS